MKAEPAARMTQVSRSRSRSLHLARATPICGGTGLWISALVSACITAFISCDFTDDPRELATLGQARPQAIVYLDDDVLAVTDVAYRDGVWGEGRVIFLNPKTGTRYGARFTSIENPQRLRVTAEHLALISSGPIELSGTPRGDLSALSVSSRVTPLTVERELRWRATPRGTFAVDTQRSDTAGHLVTSGLDGILWRIKFPSAGSPSSSSLAGQGEVELEATRYAPSDTLSLGAPLRWRDLTLVVDFNSDRLSVINARGEIAPCAPELGRFVGVMEGAQTPHVSGDLLWVSFGLSGRLVEVDLSALDLENPSCEPSISTYEPALGQVPNDLIVTADSVYVLHSAESAIWRYRRDQRARDAVWPLPPQTNPWHFALSPDQSTFAVSEWARGGVTLVRARDGVVSRLIDPRELAPPPKPRCDWSVERSVSGWRSDEGEIELSWPNGASSVTARALDVQGAAQLALVFAPHSGPALIEARSDEGAMWTPLMQLGGGSPRSSSAIAQVWRADVDVSALEVGERSVLSARVESLSATPLPPLGTSAPSLGARDGDDSSRIYELDPCALFEPQVARRYNASHFDLTALSPRSESESESESEPESESLWGGAHPDAGHIKLDQIRLIPLDLTRPVHLIAATHRRW